VDKWQSKIYVIYKRTDIQQMVEVVTDAQLQGINNSFLTLTYELALC